MTQERLKAKIMVYENAAAFIEGHGEEGGLTDETFDFPLKYYLKEAKKLAKRLQRQAEKMSKTINQ